VPERPAGPDLRRLPVGPVSHDSRNVDPVIGFDRARELIGRGSDTARRRPEAGNRRNDGIRRRSVVCIPMPDAYG
jgi:hypothetical protein